MNLGILESEFMLLNLLVTCYCSKLGRLDSLSSPGGKVTGRVKVKSEEISGHVAQG